MRQNPTCWKGCVYQLQNQPRVPAVTTSGGGSCPDSSRIPLAAQGPEPASTQRGEEGPGRDEKFRWVLWEGGDRLVHRAFDGARGAAKQDGHWARDFLQPSGRRIAEKVSTSESRPWNPNSRSPLYRQAPCGCGFCWCFVALTPRRERHSP